MESSSASVSQILKKSSFSGQAPGAADEDIPVLQLYAPDYSEENAAVRRDRFMTKQHTISEKMQLYNCSTQGRIDELQRLLNEQNYSVTEEVSKEGHFWTVLHYASHYGHFKVLEFLVNHLEDNDNSFDILNMQTLEGKTPLFCAILSCDIKQAQLKKDIIKLLFDTGKIDLSLRKGSGEDLLDLAKRNQLYDFIVTSCLRED